MSIKPVFVDWDWRLAVLLGNAGWFVPEGGKDWVAMSKVSADDAMQTGRVMELAGWKEMVPSGLGLPNPVQAALSTDTALS